MAIMIPSIPLHYKKESMEDAMFYALETELPNDYYVFHSFRINRMKDKSVHEREVDFLVYNRNKGILVLEAKAGHVYYDPEDRLWYYQSKKRMSHNGPFNQAVTAKWDLYDEIAKMTKLAHLTKHCKFCSGVWFPSISDGELKNMNLPMQISPQMVMTKEALNDPLQYIDQLFMLPSDSGNETNLTDNEHAEMLYKVLCPKFNIMPTATAEMDIQKTVFHRMLKEQQLILDFLSEQRAAVINGPAGTGKTLIAVEKAKRHSATGQRVLFLCYNSFLRDHLDENYHDANVDFMTIAQYACRLCRTAEPDYKALKELLDEYYMEGNFPYSHIIIDEGQDFGVKDIVSNQIMDTLKMIAEAKEPEGSFYVFYDRLQFVQGTKIPGFLSDSDCKMTLYKNCRNTENIAVTSLRPITERNPKVYEDAVKGEPAKIIFCSSAEEEKKAIEYAIGVLKADGINNAVILTCKTEEKSVLSSEIRDGLYKSKYRFSTCRKFKGLEADVIVLVDVNKDSFSTDLNKQLFYVGASRARLRLMIVANLTDDDSRKILEEDMGVNRKIKRPKMELAGKLNAIPEKIG